jgi:multiple sugar transport system substrate-binding protein
MKRKVLSVLLAAAMSVTLLAGCGDKTEDSGNDKATETKDEGTKDTGTEDAATEDSDAAANTDPAALSGEFTYWSFTDSANNVVKEFNKVYPDVKVNLQVFSGDEYRTKILTALQNGTDVPDAFDLEDAYMYDFLDSDLLADLSYINIEDLVKDSFEFQNAAMKDSTGKYKTMLFQSSPVCMWYLRDVAEKYLGTSDPVEISAKIPDWKTMLEVAKEVNEKSNGKVFLWPNMGEIIKVDSFSFPELVQDGKLVISDEWMQMISDLRMINDSKYVAKLDSWSSDWASQWNEGNLIFRVMPSWDFFTDWDKNTGNVGVCAAPRSSSEGNTGISVYEKSEKKDLVGEFLKFVASDEFQKTNLESYNQVPVNKRVCDELAAGYTNEQFGGQNILATYSEICANIPGVTPNKYTRTSINNFQKAATNGIKDGQSDEDIIAEFKSLMRDQFPEITID